jgi:hypothetical protein
MKSTKWTVLVCMAFLLTAATAIASDPIGIYAIVEKVVLEPNDTAPQTIQIWGVFALSDANHGDNYHAPERGYLYYSLPGPRVQAQRNSALTEWTDLKKLAGARQAIGFGGRYIVTGRVRKATEKPEAPDVYPVQMGIVKMDGSHLQSTIVTQLQNALKSK